MEEVLSWINSFFANMAKFEKTIYKMCESIECWEDNKISIDSTVFNNAVVDSFTLRKELDWKIKITVFLQKNEFISINKINTTKEILSKLWFNFNVGWGGIFNYDISSNNPEVILERLENIFTKIDEGLWINMDNFDFVSSFNVKRKTKKTVDDSRNSIFELLWDNNEENYHEMFLLDYSWKDIDLVLNESNQEELDESPNVTFLCSTNVNRDELDPAIVRPWRIEWDIYVEEPNELSRAKLFKGSVNVRKKNDVFDDDIDFDLLGKISFDMTWASIEKIINDTILYRFYQSRKQWVEFWKVGMKAIIDKIKSYYTNTHDVNKLDKLLESYKPKEIKKSSKVVSLR